MITKEQILESQVAAATDSIRYLASEIGRIKIELDAALAAKKVADRSNQELRDVLQRTENVVVHYRRLYHEQDVKRHKAERKLRDSERIIGDPETQFTKGWLAGNVAMRRALDDRIKSMADKLYAVGACASGAARSSYFKQADDLMVLREYLAETLCEPAAGIPEHMEPVMD